MKTYLFPHQELGFIQDYLTYNNFDFEIYDTYDTTLDTYGRHIISRKLSDTSGNLLILYIPVFYEMMSWPESKQRLIDFCNNNKLWLTRDRDCFFDLFHNARPGAINNSQHIWTDLDRQVPPGSITFIPNFVPTVDCWLNDLKNIRVEPFQVLVSENFVMQYRFNGSLCEKNLDSKDFMLLMTKKSQRPHRDYLWNELHQRSHLMKNATVRYNPTDSRGDIDLAKNYIGYQIKNQTWILPFPSMDLYCNHFVEIVPETLCANAYFVTEKTIKPILTRTPFIILSTPGYLAYLKSWGFKTFDSLIDESYDNEPQLEKRVRKATDSLEQILKYGSKDFYQASTKILDHNQDRLFRLFGSYKIDMDMFLHKIYPKTYMVDQ